jgi:hypothetical protein
LVSAIIIMHLEADKGQLVTSHSFLKRLRYTP